MTMFCFRTGRLTTEGSHQKLTLNIKLNEYKLSSLYKDTYSEEILNKIIDIESKKPMYPNYIHSKIIKRIVEYKDETNILTKNNYTLVISKLYEEFKNKQKYFQIYMSKLDKIENLHLENKLSLEELNNI